MRHLQGSLKVHFKMTMMTLLTILNSLHFQHPGQSISQEVVEKVATELAVDEVGFQANFFLMVFHNSFLHSGGLTMPSLAPFVVPIVGSNFPSWALWEAMSK